jgi:hypothetical protein
MSSFFEPPAPPPELPPQPPRQPWAGARDAVIGKTVALNLMIGRSEKAALWIPAVTASSDGFEFDIELRYRFEDERFEHPFFFHHHPTAEQTTGGGTRSRPLKAWDPVLRWPQGNEYREPDAFPHAGSTRGNS